MLEGTSRLFSPDVSIAELMSKYYPHMIRRRLSPTRILGKTRRMLTRLGPAHQHDAAPFVRAALAHA